MWYESANNVYGRSNNPYHTGRMVGGSSGGEACAISSGCSIFGIGSDVGGSIRMPAFFNGIFGHKPSTGIVSNYGSYFQNLCWKKESTLNFAFFRSITTSPRSNQHILIHWTTLPICSRPFAHVEGLGRAQAKS